MNAGIDTAMKKKDIYKNGGKAEPEIKSKQMSCVKSGSMQRIAKKKLLLLVMMIMMLVVVTVVVYDEESQTFVRQDACNDVNMPSACLL